MARVLVTDGEQRAALAVIRSLGRAGHDLLVASADGRSLAGASRYAHGDLPLGNPLTSAEAYQGRVLDAVRTHAPDILLPIGEAALLATLPLRDQLAPVLLPFPDLVTFRRVSDKACVADAALSVGLAVPGQTTIAERTLADTLPDVADAPLVLKPGRSIQGGRKLGVSYVDAGGRLRATVAGLPAEAFPLLVQQRVVGPGTGVFLLRWGGGTRATFAHRRLREKPPSGGVSVLRESVPLDPALQARAEALLDALGWHGVAMLELKIDASSGVPHVMEINGRFWGSLQLAIDAGVDFPTLLVDAAGGSPAEPPPPYRIGVKSRWLLGDLDHLLLRMSRSSASLDLPPGAPGRIRTLGAFLTSFLPPTRSEVLRWTDPRPFARELRLWVRQLV